MFANLISPYFNKYNIPILTHFSSTGEKEVISYIKILYQKEFPVNTRKIITPLELDIYLEELNLAVEFNGTYWHSDKEKLKDYHFNKMKLCYEKNIRLINIYEYEWESNKEDIKHWLKKYIDNNSKKNNFKFKEILEPDVIVINSFDIYDAGQIVLKRN